MCFSAGASFSAAALLGGVAYASLKKGAKTPYLYLAMIPLFFAIQQAAEGVLWVSLKNGYYPSLWGLSAEYFFLLFAFVVYPVWIPLSLSILEKNPFRRNLLFLFLGFGVYIALYNVYFILFSEKLEAKIVDCSIQYYQGTIEGKIGYAIPIFLPMFLSSIRWMSVFGIITLFTFVISLIFYSVTFTSVWCFFAAIVSVMIYVILQKNIRS